MDSPPCVNTAMAIADTQIIDHSFREFLEREGWALPDPVISHLSDIMQWAVAADPLLPAPTISERYFWLAEHGTAELWRDYADRLLWTLGVWPQWRVSQRYREDLCQSSYWTLWQITGWPTYRVISQQIKVCQKVISAYVGAEPRSNALALPLLSVCDPPSGPTRAGNTARPSPPGAVPGDL